LKERCCDDENDPNCGVTILDHIVSFNGSLHRLHEKVFKLKFGLIMSAGELGSCFRVELPIFRTQQGDIHSTKG
jgi:hypothetical protein